MVNILLFAFIMIFQLPSPIDSSGNGYTLFELRHEPISYNRESDHLLLVNRAYNPTGVLNTHSASGDLSSWFHEIAYNQSFGPARYPSTQAGFCPYISFPILVDGTWGGFGVIKWSDWFSSPECSISVSFPGIFVAVSKQLPDSNLIVIALTTGNGILYWTFTPVLDSIISCDTLVQNATYFGFDINGGVAYIFYSTISGLRYRTTTDGINWSPEQIWNIQFTPPFPGYVHYVQIAVNDSAEARIVFDYWNSEDLTYPYYGRIYLSHTSGLPPVDLTAALPDTEAMYPTIACSENYAAVIFNIPRNDLRDSLAWMDIFVCTSTDNGITWSEPYNITEDNLSSRIGLQQIAKRIDTIRHQFYYTYCANMTNNYDPYFQIWGLGQAVPIYLYVDICPILGITESHRDPVGAQEIMVYPNPFIQEITIKYHPVQNEEDGGIRIYDITGRCLKYWSEQATIHTNSVIWDGCDINGKQVPQGIYLVSFRNNYIKIIKID